MMSSFVRMVIEGGRRNAMARTLFTRVIDCVEQISVGQVDLGMPSSLLSIFRLPSLFTCKSVIRSIASSA